MEMISRRIEFNFRNICAFGILKRVAHIYCYSKANGMGTHAECNYHFTVEKIFRSMLKLISLLDFF
jgi:hypothetical protein